MGRHRRASLALLIAGIATAVLAVAGPAMAKRYRADIRRTDYGIPHIKARDYGGLGFGFGYAFAQDNICTMADDYVTVNAQRSRYFGPDGAYRVRGNTTVPTNLNSDFFWKQIIDSKTVPRLVSRKAPLGPLREVKAVMRGYVAGYNRYLRSVGGSRGVKDPRCRGAAWVKRISIATAYRRLYQLILLASQGVAVNGIASAQPPVGGGSAGAARPPVDALASALNGGLLRGGLGSNAVAIGRDGNRDGKHGLLLGNPHFPWMGPERFYQFQFAMRKLRVSGATLFGVPSVLIGYTRSVAWSHTVSTAYRFTPYELKLAPGDPTSYLVDGKSEPMSRRAVTVMSRRADGSLEPRTRTLYATRWGPVLTELVGVPLPWTTDTAFAMADANAGNFRAFNHFFAVDRARSVPQVLRILRRYQGIPWVNTIAADRAGRALYADIGTMPGVTDAKAQGCNTPLGTALFQAARLPVLDGSRSDCAWERDPAAAEQGLLGPGRQPALVRSDYVTNSNDSYWLSNPKQPLEGFPRIIGDERTARSLRTRIGLIMVGDRLGGADGLGPPGFTRATMRRTVTGNRVYGGELTRSALVDMCRQFQLAGGMAPSSSGLVPVGDSCDVLAAWDLKANVGSRGDLLFRAFWNRAFDSPGVWSKSFDAADPVRTPNTLNTLDPNVRIAFGDALQALRAAGIPFGAALGEHQYVDRGGRRIPIPGGQGDPDGVFNAMVPEREMFPDAPNTPFGPGLGSSYVQVVTWGRSRCPRASTILTYSLSENPRSRHGADQTRLFSRGGWVRDRFCESEIRRSPKLRVKTVRSGSPRRR